MASALPPKGLEDTCQRHHKEPKRETFQRASAKTRWELVCTSSTNINKQARGAVLASPEVGHLPPAPGSTRTGSVRSKAGRHAELQGHSASTFKSRSVGGRPPSATSVQTPSPSKPEPALIGRKRKAQPQRHGRYGRSDVAPSAGASMKSAGPTPYPASRSFWLRHGLHLRTESGTSTRMLAACRRSLRKKSEAAISHFQSNCLSHSRHQSLQRRRSWSWSSFEP